MVFAGFCLCVLLASCAEDAETMPDMDLQEVLDQEGIDDIRYGNGDDRDSSNMGGL